MKPFVLGSIFARGGSKGVPGKNVKLLCGKPLIAYAIEAGLAVSKIDKLIVSTDDQEIASIAKEYGAEVPFMRPSELARDDSPELLSWKHAISKVSKVAGREVDVLVSIPPTSPLREARDVDRCLDKLLDTDADVVVTVRECERNPYYNMVERDAEGNLSVVKKVKETIRQRQEAPHVYDVTTVAYAAKAKFILEGNAVFDGKTEMVIVPKERSLDIDTELDFEYAEFMMNRKFSIT